MSAALALIPLAALTALGLGLAARALSAPSVDARQIRQARASAARVE